MKFYILIHGENLFYYIFAITMERVERRHTIWGQTLLVVFLVMLYGIETHANDFLPGRLNKPYVADSILEQIFQSSSIYATKVKSYEAELYLKGRMQIHKQNRIIKYVPSMFRLEKGIKDYIHESISELHYTAPDIYDRKIRAISTTFPGGNSRFFDILDYLKFNIYAPSVMGDKILSPLNKQSSAHYTYHLESTTYWSGEKTYKIHITPRFKSTQLLEGNIWISANDYTIRYLEFRGRYDVIRFHLSMKMGDTEETKYLPQLVNLDVNFKFLLNHLEMNYTGWLTYKKVSFQANNEKVENKYRNDKSRYNLTKSYTLTCDTVCMIQNRDSFNRIRPIPLSEWEDSLYQSFDKRHQIQVQDTLKKEETKFQKNLTYIGQIGDALISSYDIDITKIGSINCSPLINPLLVSYSHSNGISYRQEFKYNKLFHDGRLLHIVPQIGYNFTKKELYAQMDAEYIYNPSKHGSITFGIGNGNRIYSSIVLDQLKEIPDSIFSFDGLNLDYFKDVYLNVAHNIEIINGLNLWTGISMHWRHTKSSPEVEARGVRSQYNSFAPRIRIEWTPGMYYYMNGKRKINVGSRFPTFVADYERGIQLMKHSGKYERLEFSAEQKIRFRQLHTIAYHIGGGFFTNQDDMYFVDYVNFANRNLPQGWNDDMGGTFQMLDGRWYNASRHYFRGNMTYETPFLLLYPVTRLLSFIQKERIYAGILFMPHLNPYIELGYGIGTHLFDGGVFIGNEKGRFTSVGFKFTFELFNK